MAEIHRDQALDPETDLVLHGYSARTSHAMRADEEMRSNIEEAGAAVQRSPRPGHPVTEKFRFHDCYGPAEEHTKRVSKVILY